MDGRYLLAAAGKDLLEERNYSFAHTHPGNAPIAEVRDALLQDGIPVHLAFETSPAEEIVSRHLDKVTGIPFDFGNSQIDEAPSVTIIERKILVVLGGLLKCKTAHFIGRKGQCLLRIVRLEPVRCQTIAQEVDVHSWTNNECFLVERTGNIIEERLWVL